MGDPLVVAIKDGDQRVMLDVGSIFVSTDILERHNVLVIHRFLNRMKIDIILRKHKRFPTLYTLNHD